MLIHRQFTHKLTETIYFRKSGILVSARRQSVPVVVPSAIRTPVVHDVHQHCPVLGRVRRGAVPDQGGHAVRVFHANGPGNGMCHRAEHIVQW